MLHNCKSMYLRAPVVSKLLLNYYFIMPLFQFNNIFHKKLSKAIQIICPSKKRLRVRRAHLMGTHQAEHLHSRAEWTGTLRCTWEKS